MADSLDMTKKVQELQHLMGDQDLDFRFTSPSFLREVPSFTSTESVPLKGETDSAKLWGRTE